MSGETGELPEGKGEGGGMAGCGEGDMPGCSLPERNNSAKSALFNIICSKQID